MRCVGSDGSSPKGTEEQHNVCVLCSRNSTADTHAVAFRNASGTVELRLWRTRTSMVTRRMEAKVWLTWRSFPTYSPVVPCADTMHRHIELYFVDENVSANHTQFIPYLTRSPNFRNANSPLSPNQSTTQPPNQLTAYRILFGAHANSGVYIFAAPQPHCNQNTFFFSLLSMLVGSSCVCVCVCLFASVFRCWANERICTKTIESFLRSSVASPPFTLTLGPSRSR